MMRLVTDEADYDYMPPAFELHPAAPASVEWSAEVDMILSAMDAAAVRPAGERRSGGRRGLRARADLRLYAHDPAEPPITLFTRDVNATGVGFITQNPLPLGYNGLVRITVGNGETITASCSVRRCREAIGGWYEGALHFTSRQPNLG
ncbi:MAG TPA: PilZ domain-containing protein [Tepidisphaeraceae bacterium]|jgi:hypothetical protein